MWWRLWVKKHPRYGQLFSVQPIFGKYWLWPLTLTSCLVFLTIFGIIWPWPVTLTYSQGYPQFGHWMRLMCYTLVPSMKCVGEIASEIWPVLFFTYFGEIWPWPVTLVVKCTLLSYNLAPSWFFLSILWKIWPWPLSMSLTLVIKCAWINGLYDATKYEVCRWNRTGNMANCLIFYSLIDKMDLDLDFLLILNLRSVDLRWCMSIF